MLKKFLRFGKEKKDQEDMKKENRNSRFKARFLLPMRWRKND